METSDRIESERDSDNATDARAILVVFCALVLGAVALWTCLSLPALADHPTPLPDVIVTPHLGEMSRLTGLAAAQLEENRVDAALEWAQRWGVAGS